MAYEVKRFEAGPQAFTEQVLCELGIAPWQVVIMLHQCKDRGIRNLGDKARRIMGSRFVQIAGQEYSFAEYVAPYIAEYERRTGRHDAGDILRDTIAKYGALRFRDIDTGANQVACLKEILAQLTGEKQP
jgi:hypothetical protein